jgi:hypothetical protein
LKSLAVISHGVIFTGNISLRATGVTGRSIRCAQMQNFAVVGADKTTTAKTN